MPTPSRTRAYQRAAGGDEASDGAPVPHAPPLTYRDPSARSAPPSTAAIRRGTSCGSCEKSQSISSTARRRRRARAAKAGEVGGAEPLLALAVQDVDVVELRGEPVGELARAVGRVVVDRRERARPCRRARAASARDSRARCRSGGRRRPEAPRVYSMRGRRSASQRRRGRAAGASGRPAGARGRGVVPGARLPARGDADPGDGRLRRRACAGRARQGAARDRQDDRGEDRPGRRGRRDARADEAEEDRPAGGRPASCVCPGSGRRLRRASGRSSG